MSKIIHAVYENGVFRPIEDIALPNNSNVVVELRLVVESEKWPAEYFIETSGVFVDEEFGRPEQGLLPERSRWQ